MTWLRVLLLASVLAGAPIWPAPPVNAHASLVEALPADGAVLDEAPRFVQLRFNEPISPVMVKLIGSDGHVRDNITFKAQNEAIEVALPPDLGQGTHILSFRVISADGHPVGGTLMFSIGQVTGAGTADLGSSDPYLPPLIWLTRITLYLALFIGVGGAFFRARIATEGSWPAAASKLIGSAIAFGLVAVPISVGLQGLDALAAPLSLLGVPSVWMAGFETSVGGSAIAGIIALLFAALALRANRVELARALAIIAMAGVGLSLALTGHASTAPPQIVTRPAVFIHAVGAAYWLGALIPLALMFNRGVCAEKLATIERFSAVAMPIVGSLVVAGAVLAIVQVERPSALIDSRYGWIFLAKMLAVLLLLTLAARNRFVLTPALATQRPDAETKLKRSIGFEIGLIIAILALVAVWRFTPPPRALAVAISQPASIHIHTAKAMVDFSLTPARVGPTRASMVFLTGDFAPLDPREVTVILSKPDSAIEGIARKAERASDGTWTVDKFILPMAGKWHVRIDVLVTDFDKIILEDEIFIAP
jgi:copper transport protein